MEQFLKTTIKEAGQIAKDYFHRGVEHSTKSHIGDFLTEADIEVSKFFVDKIHKEFPHHRIHSEEMKDDVNPEGEYEWVIDPIDGTRNFALGIPLWCHLVAVLHNGELEMSGIYNPNSEMMFFAHRGKGATLNDKPIHVNNVTDLYHSLSFFLRDLSSDHPERYKKFVEYMINNTNSWMHNYGTMFQLCFVATGAADFFVGNTGLDHDNLAPALICKEAGALVTDSDGNPWQRTRRDMVIANPVLHKKLMEILHK